MGKKVLGTMLVVAALWCAPLAAQFSGYAFGGFSTSRNAGYENPGVQLGLFGEYRFAEDFSVEGTLRQRWQSKIDRDDGLSQSGHLGFFYTQGFRAGVGSYSDSYTTEAWDKVGYALFYEVGYGRVDGEGSRRILTLFRSEENNTVPETRVPIGLRVELVRQRDSWGFAGVTSRLLMQEFVGLGAAQEDIFASEFNLVFLAR